ncbi:hypothetical protein H0A36_13020 [Endozoicomonas sp. SM1973]|uniref:Uncharacterized protein n=1 Tax=Spartinivicinus marinus TaxID=2994442 RepID=A0A853IH84_9GAMM|nr:hypothetical protein [Spartinivicinus marinus]MCX4029683.1 hypothetical protein [Spartinivicinus marinus]NYZ66936.1 hypothetical protein [Spartinivicinus marinus]
MDQVVEQAIKQQVLAIFAESKNKPTYVEKALFLITRWRTPILNVIF